MVSIWSFFYKTTSDNPSRESRLACCEAPGTFTSHRILGLHADTGLGLLQE
jgi:hypothetical protein